MRASAASNSQPRETGLNWLTWRRAFTALALYFLLQGVLRVLISRSAELDESEQLLWTQSWAWGYGSDPPLYTWLQILTFHLCGTSILGLALLKNVLLFGGFYFTYLAGKEAGQSKALGVVSMLALLLFPQVTWESQRDLTHSVLATGLAAATFFNVTQIQRAPRAALFAWLGLVAGLGILSKYSYGLFALALGGAFLSLPEFRRLLRTKWVLLAAAVFLLVTGWHFHWVLTKPAAAFSRPDEIIRASRGWRLAGWGRGFLSLGKCAVMLGGCAVTAFVLIFPRTDRHERSEERSRYVRLAGRTLGVVLIISVLVVLSFAIELKDRWFQPVVFVGAILASLLVRNRVNPVSARRFFVLAAAVVGVVLVVLPGIPLAAAVTKRPTRLNAPYSALCRELRDKVGEPPVIVAESRLVGGNLRLWFPNSIIIAPEYSILPVSTNLPWLAAWDASKREEPLPGLPSLIGQLRGINLSNLAPAYVEAPFRYTSARRMRLGYVLVPKGPLP